MFSRLNAATAAACSTARPGARGVSKSQVYAARADHRFIAHWYSSGAPTTYGTWGSASDGTRGSVSALATGARPTAPAIAAAANHGAMYLVIVFTVFPACLLGRRIWLCPIIASRQTGVATTDPHSTLPLAGIRLPGPPCQQPIRAVSLAISSGNPTEVRGPPRGVPGGHPYAAAVVLAAVSPVSAWLLTPNAPAP